jgi:hypothetical protein
MLDSWDPKPAFEQGVIAEANVGEGTVRVRTTNGRVLDNVRLPSMVAGPGFGGMSGMPHPGTECLVAVFGDRYYLVATYAPRTNRAGVQGPSTETLPGEIRMDFENGGHALFSPDGTIDLMAHPWARTFFLAREHMVREFMRKWERISGPHNLLRSVNDVEDELSFFEFFLNERFVYRKTDKTPSIIWTLGDQSSSKTSPGNPGSKYLYLMQVEQRDSQSIVKARHKDERGLVDGVSRRETTWTKDGDVTVTEELGNQDGLAQKEVVSMGDDDIQIESKEGHFDTDKVISKEATVGGESKYKVEVLDTGQVKITNPSWTVTLQENKVAIIESEDTRIKLNGEQIEIGMQGGQQPMVLGNDLVSLLNEMISWLSAHTHPTPTGPSGPPLTAALLSSIQTSYTLNSGSPNAKILSNANTVSEGANYPSGGGPSTAE